MGLLWMRCHFTRHLTRVEDCFCSDLYSAESEMMHTDSLWYLGKFSSAFAAASKQPTAHEIESPGVGQVAEVDLIDLSAGVCR